MRPFLPERPSLKLDVLTEFELHGVDSMRAVLASSTNGHSGTGRATVISFGRVSVQRGDIEDWLKWKGAVSDVWIRIGVVAAFAAAVFSLIAILK
jgi:hypothetical protein